MKGFYLLWCDHQWFTRQKIIWETRPAPRLIAIFADVANIQNQIWDTNNKRMQCWMVLHHVLILPAPSCNVFLTHATQQGLDWSPFGSWQTYQGLMSTEQLRSLPFWNLILVQTEEPQLMCFYAWTGGADPGHIWHWGRQGWRRPTRLQSVSLEGVVPLRSVFFWFKYLSPQVLAFLNSSGEDEKMVRHGNNSMKERRKSLSNSGSGPNSSNSNFGQRRKSLTNSSSSNMMGERRSSFSNISGHSPPSSTLSPPPAVQVLLDLVKMLKSLTCFSLNI